MCQHSNSLYFIQVINSLLLLLSAKKYWKLTYLLTQQVYSFTSDCEKMSLSHCLNLQFQVHDFLRFAIFWVHREKMADLSLPGQPPAPSLPE